MLYPTFFTIQKEEKAIVCDHLFLFLHLFYFESYSVREISQLIDLTESAVKTRLSRARVALKKKMEGGVTSIE